MVPSATGGGVADSGAQGTDEETESDPDEEGYELEYDVTI